MNEFKMLSNIAAIGSLTSCANVSKKFFSFLSSCLLTLCSVFSHLLLMVIPSLKLALKSENALSKKRMYVLTSPPLLFWISKGNFFYWFCLRSLQKHDQLLSKAKQEQEVISSVGFQTMNITNNNIFKCLSQYSYGCFTVFQFQFHQVGTFAWLYVT